MKKIFSMIFAILLMFSFLAFSISAEETSEFLPLIEEVTEGDGAGFLEEVEIYSEKRVAKIGNQNYATLDEALAAVDNDETIVLLEDISLTTSVVINNGKIFTIDGNDGEISHKITVPDAKGSISIAAGTEVTIKNVAFEGNGNRGNNFFVVNGKLVLSDNTIIDNVGQAIHVSTGLAVMDSETSVIKNCTATNFGGAAFIDGGGEFVLNAGIIENCKNNDTYWPGGAITVMWGHPSKFTMNGGIIRNCFHVNGGAIGGYQGAVITITGGTIEKCMATNAGGAIYTCADTWGVTVNISGGIIKNNTAGSSGGAIASADGTDIIRISGNADVTGNKVGAVERGSESIYLDGKGSWKIVGGTGYKSDGLEILLDCDNNTWWHSAYTATEEGTITWHDEPPFDFEIILPEATYISGFSTMPRTSNATGWITEWEFYAAENDDDEYTLMHEGTYPSVPTEKIFEFSQNVKVKRIKFVAKDTLAGFFVLAEFDLLKPLKELKNADSIESYVVGYEELKPIKMDPVKFKATASNSWGTINGAEKVIDGKNDRVWQTFSMMNMGYPYTLEIDLGRVSEIIKLVYVPGVSINGIWKNYDLEVSETGKDGTYVKVLEGNGFEEIHETQEVKFKEPVKGRYFRFVINESVGKYVSCGELEFYETKRGNEDGKENNRWILTVDSNEVEAIKDGISTTIEMEGTPYIDGVYTQIPLRGLLEDMGAEIEWDETHRKVIIDYGKKHLELQIMNHRVYVTDEQFGEVRYSLAVPPKLKNSKVFVPLRIISEHLGYTVEWDEENRMITIY